MLIFSLIMGNKEGFMNNYTFKFALFDFEQ